MLAPFLTQLTQIQSHLNQAKNGLDAKQQSINDKADALKEEVAQVTEDSKKGIQSLQQTVTDLHSKLEKLQEQGLQAQPDQKTEKEEETQNKAKVINPELEYHVPALDNKKIKKLAQSHFKRLGIQAKYQGTISETKWESAALGNASNLVNNVLQMLILHEGAGATVHDKLDQLYTITQLSGVAQDLDIAEDYQLVKAAVAGKITQPELTSKLTDAYTNLVKEQTNVSFNEQDIIDLAKPDTSTDQIGKIFTNLYIKPNACKNIYKFASLAIAFGVLQGHIKNPNA